MVGSARRADITSTTQVSMSFAWLSTPYALIQRVMMILRYADRVLRNASPLIAFMNNGASPALSAMSVTSFDIL